MSVKLILDESLFALYKEDTAEYVYLGGGNGVFGFKAYPKPTGMAPTVEKLQKKHEKLLSRLQEFADNGEPDQHPEEVLWERNKHVYQNDIELFRTIRARNKKSQKQFWGEQLEIAKKFIIVEISVKKV